MPKSLQAIRGMNDILPDNIIKWQYLEDVLRQVATSYGYHEIRFPLVEQTELFKRTIGEVTDIVEKEMYTFPDRNNDSLTLRPEGTAGCVRAGIEHGLLYNQIQRLWYAGAMFRHERPQKGRYRQFHQFGIETFGLQGPDIDAEHILLTARIWKTLNINDKLILQINNLGNKECRINYRDDLVSYFEKHINLLDTDSKRRLTSNPLRILDNKNPHMQDLIANAPKLLDYLDVEANKHFIDLQKILDTAKIDYAINPRLVRGLDYYCLTVFEWINKDESGAQNAICAGGRYDGLVEQLGGTATPAVGFAIGLERLIELIATETLLEKQLKIYLILSGEKSTKTGLILAEDIRNSLPKVTVITNCGGGSLKAQFKRADKSGAAIALTIADDEIENGTVTVKQLRRNMPQITIAADELIDYLEKII